MSDIVDQLLELDEAIEAIDKEIKRLQDELELESKAFEIYKKGVMHGIYYGMTSITGELNA